MGEDEKEKMAEEEVEEEVEEEEEEAAAVGREEEARAGQPLLRASQPALYPNRQSALAGAEREAGTVPRPAVTAIDEGQSEGTD